MNKLQARRLMNVARACRESESPKDFTMARFTNTCGTPGCALGHYVARTDLQRIMVEVYHAGIPWPVLRDNRDRAVDYDSPETRRHFGLDSEALTELFSPWGCGRASTSGQAARYIERFVMDRIGARFRA